METCKCSICGRKPQVYICGHRMTPVFEHIWVAYHSCNNSNVSAYGPSEEEAIKNWNLRITGRL